MKANRNKRTPGFVLMEALLAFIVFGVSITAAIKVLHHMSELNHSIVHKSAMSKRAQSLMIQIIHEATADGEFTRDLTLDLDEQTEAHILVTSIEATNDDDNILDEMYLIELSLHSKIDRSAEPQKFSMVHYRNAFGNPSL